MIGLEISGRMRYPFELCEDGLILTLCPDSIESDETLEMSDLIIEGSETDCNILKDWS